MKLIIVMFVASLSWSVLANEGDFSHKNANVSNIEKELTKINQNLANHDYEDKAVDRLNLDSIANPKTDNNGITWSF